MFHLNRILHWIFLHKLYLDLPFSLKKIVEYKNKVLSKYSNIFRFLRIYKQIFEYIRLSKNLQMNIRIYSYWGDGTNTNTNNIRGPFHSNIWIFVLITGICFFSCLYREGQYPPNLIDMEFLVSSCCSCIQ